MRQRGRRGQEHRHFFEERSTIDGSEEGLTGGFVFAENFFTIRRGKGFCEEAAAADKMPDMAAEQHAGVFHGDNPGFRTEDQMAAICVGEGDARRRFAPFFEGGGNNDHGQ